MPECCRESTLLLTGRSAQGRVYLIDRLVDAINCLADIIEGASDTDRPVMERSLRAPQVSLSRPRVADSTRCNHPEGHELTLSAAEGLTMETLRECPCCGARQWISMPSVGAMLDAANDCACIVPGLNVELTRRERQVLNMLHRSPYPLRHGQLAGLVWSDSDRTHDVRSVVYQLRRKLRNTGWAIPFSARGRGIRLVADVTQQSQVSESGLPVEGFTTSVDEAAKDSSQLVYHGPE